MNIWAICLKFTTCAPLNFFVYGPISIQFFSAENKDQEGHMTKYTPLDELLQHYSSGADYLPQRAEITWHDHERL